jgi:phospholipid/cholesterol/gamma-HCH transport system substrate-binding protein
VQELKKGDPVKMAGVEIGRVESIRLADSQARVSMKVEGRYRLRTDSKATIKFAGLMGQNFISVEGGSPNAPLIEQGGFIEAGSQPDLSELMAKLQNVASGVEGLTKSFSAENLSTLIGPMNDFLRQNSTNLTAILSNTATVTFQISQGRGTIGKLIYDDALYNTAMTTIGSLQAAGSQAQTFLSNAQGMMNKASGIIDEVSTGQGTIGRLLKEDKLYVQTTEAMDNLKQILEKMNRGQGSVGQLINDETFLKNARMTLQKVDKATEGLEDQGPLSVLGIAVNTLF